MVDVHGDETGAMGDEAGAPMEFEDGRPMEYEEEGEDGQVD